MKQIEVHGLEELQTKMAAYPLEYGKVMAHTTTTALLVLHENVPPYPDKPEGSTYKRTGTLGRSLGISESGGKLGIPSIFKVRRVGGFDFQGRFGTNLNYAPDVIGSPGQQRPFFAAYWWRLESIVRPAQAKILQVYQKAAEALARFLEGR